MEQRKTIRLIGHTPSAKSVLKSSPLPSSNRRRIFLLSPANVNSVRGELVLANPGPSSLSERLQDGGVPLGEVFSFISGLYFRGKLAYARAFADPPAGLPGIVVITSSAGLVSPDTLFTLEALREITAGRVDAAECGYRIPLERDACLLRDHMGKRCEVVLLGSVATPKYVEPLLGIFGESLMFPQDFVGRGDMSRGGLLLRCVREECELTYIPVAGAVRHGVRPPRLPKLARRSEMTVVTPAAVR